MKLLIVHKWSTYIKGQEVEVDDATGHHLIGTGVASVIEMPKPAKKVEAAVMVSPAPEKPGKK